MSLLNRLVSLASTLVRDTVRTRSGAGRPTRGRTDHTIPAAPSPEQPEGAARSTVEYTGDLPRFAYAPQPDDDADPGEIVWAWVPYDENDGRGKDRPVLVLARHQGGYLGLQTTSKDHDRDREDEARWGRYWFDIGSGDWDSQHRESEVRLDRVLFMPSDAVRREGAALDRARYDAVVAAFHDHRQR